MSLTEILNTIPTLETEANVVSAMENATRTFKSLARASMKSAEAMEEYKSARPVADQIETAALIRIRAIRAAK
jgi:hypothetical protein